MGSEIEPNLIEATARILGRSRLAGLTITAIAETAGVSRVTLHRRGNRLDEYVVAALRRVSDDLRDSLWPAMTASGPAAERLTAALHTLCEVCERHRGVMSAVYATPVRQLPDQPGRTTSLEFIEPFERLLRDGNVDGSLHSDNPLPDATLLANAVCWTYLHMRSAHRWDTATARQRVIELCTASLQPADAAAH
jgi:AcrR family transcriptional regulator